LKILQL